MKGRYSSAHPEVSLVIIMWCSLFSGVFESAIRGKQTRSKVSIIVYSEYDKYCSDDEGTIQQSLYYSLSMNANSASVLLARTIRMVSAMRAQRFGPPPQST